MVRMQQSELHKPLGPWLYMLLDLHKLTKVAVDFSRQAAVTGLKTFFMPLFVSSAPSAAHDGGRTKHALKK